MVIQWVGCVESLYVSMYPTAGEQHPGGNRDSKEEGEGDKPHHHQHRPRETPVSAVVAAPARKRSLQSWWRRAAPKDNGGEAASEAASAGRDREGGERQQGRPRPPRAGMRFPIIVVLF